eukprot:Phypoly_transcript_08534.p1 GENE.Phypoly_transcript_08534~~Phypoly_transcript_08534.p1  ORF type:complete len:484 (+),score=42.58 Phypoly_transcript_08534:23-1453(+)
MNASNINMVNYLMQKGALKQPVFTTNRSSYFHYLARIIPPQAKIEMYLQIMEETAKVYQSDAFRANFILETPLHRAASAGNIVAVKWMLDSNHITIDPNQENKFGETALHHAVKSGDANVVRFLIDHFRVDVPNRFLANSPYNLAIEARLLYIAKLFPIAAKLRLHNLNAYLLQYITDFLDPIELARLSRINHRFRMLAKDTINKKYMGQSLSLMNLHLIIDRVNVALKGDLKAISTPQFMEGWNKYPYLAQVPPDVDSMWVKLITAGPNRVGATTILNRLGIANGDYVMKYVDYKGQCAAQLQYWDTMNRYRHAYDVSYKHIRSASVMIVFYDSSDSKRSIDEIQVWLGLFYRHARNCVLLFVGTCADKIRPKVTRISTKEMAEAIITHVREYDNDDIPFSYKEFGPENVDELCRFPYVIETRIDDPESMDRTLRLAALMGMRVKQNFSRANPEVENPSPPPKKSIVSSFKNLFK